MMPLDKLITQEWKDLECHPIGDATGLVVALYNLACSLVERFSEKGEIVNIDEVIELHQSALDLCSQVMLEFRLFNYKSTYTCFPRSLLFSTYSTHFHLAVVYLRVLSPPTHLSLCSIIETEVSFSTPTYNHSIDMYLATFLLGTY